VYISGSTPARPIFRPLRSIFRSAHDQSNFTVNAELNHQLFVLNSNKCHYRTL